MLHMLRVHSQKRGQRGDDRAAGLLQHIGQYEGGQRACRAFDAERLTGREPFGFLAYLREEGESGEGGAEVGERHGQSTRRARLLGGDGQEKNENVLRQRLPKTTRPRGTCPRTGSPSAGLIG